MSIEPRWVRKIFTGKKRYEYRKIAPSKCPPYRVIVYSTSPQQKIVGEFEVIDSIHDTVDTLIDRTVHETTYDNEAIQQYFAGRDRGYALKIGSVTEYDQHIPLSKMRDKYDLEPPQNFSYVSEGNYSLLRN